MKKPPGQSDALGIGCAYLFLLPFALMGLGAFGSGLSGALAGRLGEEDTLAKLIVGAIFSLVGVGGILLVRKASRDEKAKMDALARGETVLAWQDSEWFPKLKTASGPRMGVALPYETSPAAKTIGYWVLALFWNGMSWGGLLASWGEAPTFIVLFVGLFCVIGLFLAGAAIKQTFRYVMVGAAVLEIDAEPLAPGQTFAWRLYQRGDFEIERAVVSLVCQERVQYRQGTNTVTHVEPVLEDPLAEEAGIRAHPNAPVLSGEGFVPADAPHSFKASNNNVEWFLKLTMVLPGLPDIEDKFRVRVAPRTPSS